MKLIIAEKPSLGRNIASKLKSQSGKESNTLFTLKEDGKNIRFEIKFIN